MTTLLWTLRQWARRLGRTGLAGLALLALALLLRVTDVAPLEAEIAAGETRIAELESAAKVRTERAPEARAVVRAELPARATPTIKQAADRVRELERLAEKHKLALLRGQYAPTPVPGTTLVRWQILLPISAPYPQLRAFVADSLAAMPTLALDDIRLKRDKIGDHTVEADLRFNLYLQEAKP